MSHTDYEDPGSPFRRHDIASSVRKPRPRPRTLDGLIYPGKLHSIAGEPEAGKTLIVLWLLLRVMRLGHPVALFDEETGPDQVADLFQALGAEEELLSKLLHYFPYPEVNWAGHDGIVHLHKLMAEVGPVVAAFDSCATMMSAAGLRENDPADVTKLWTKTLAPLGRTFGSAVLVTDHDSKEGTASRYARGSTAKLAAVDVGWKVAVVSPFSRDMDGSLEVLITKDRPGCLHRNWQITVTRNPLHLEWAKVNGKRRGSGEHSPGKQSCLDALTTQPQTTKELNDAIVTAGGIPLKRTTMSTYLNELADAGLAERVAADPGQAVLWCLPAPEPSPQPEPQGTGPRPLDWN